MALFKERKTSYDLGQLLGYSICNDALNGNNGFVISQLVNINPNISEEEIRRATYCGFAAISAYYALLKYPLLNTSKYISGSDYFFDIYNKNVSEHFKQKHKIEHYCDLMSPQCITEQDMINQLVDRYISKLFGSIDNDKKETVANLYIQIRQNWINNFNNIVLKIKVVD